MRSTVVLPQPDGPISVTNSPRRHLEVEVVDDQLPALAEGLLQAFDP